MGEDPLGDCVVSRPSEWSVRASEGVRPSPEIFAAADRGRRFFGNEKNPGWQTATLHCESGNSVWLPLPEEVLSSLQCGAENERYFWSGVGKLKSAVADWRGSLAKLSKMAGARGHAHLLRDFFAVDLLNHGVTLENVAALLGNSVRIAEKHYAPWVQAGQVVLEDAVMKVWK